MPADDLYWSPVDFDSAESNNFSRSYIDPWDLENYDYIRQQIDTWEPYSGVGSQPGESPESTSTFVYLPGDGKYGSEFNSERTTSNYAAIDEIDVGNSKRASVAGRNGLHVSRNSNNLREPADEHNLPLMSVHEARGRLRKITQPSSRNKRTRSYSYSDGYEPLSSSQQIHKRLEEPKNDDGTSPIYDDIKVYTPSSRKFGLSRYGHLKIDYSYSWHNLHKYICN